MKDLTKLFSRRYSAVQAQDDDEAQLAAAGVAAAAAITAANTQCPADRQNAAAAAAAAASLYERQQRRKSLKANRTMKPMDILSEFFNERRSNKRARSPKCAFLFLAIGVLAITTAVLFKIIQPYDLIFKWKLVMADDGEIFNLWAKPPVDLYIKIYLFNITNAEAFLAGREKMRVEQVGPYVYKEIMTHENVTFNENNTMSTIPSHPLVWQEHLSEGNHEDDEVVMLNIAMLAISHLTAKQSFWVRMGLKTIFMSSKSQPIVRMTAKEFMFGYPSSLTTLGNTFLPNWISFEKVGLIDRMYDFSTDFETFYTGVPNPAISGLYATYRGETNLPQWNGDHCSNIEYASDGTKFKSFIEPNDTVKFFRKSMCRPINLYRVGEERTFGSLKGFNYVFEDNAFDNGAYNEANKCFCRNGDCQPVGLIDVTDCYYGFPISLSYPHFMNGDPDLISNITGMVPNPAVHSSAFVIQPESGLPLSLSVKVQINMHFKDLSAFPQVAEFSHLTAPMLWFEIMMPELPKSLDSRFNFYLNILPLVDPVGFWGALILGIGLLVYSVTRATLHMSNYARQATNISDGKYARANLLSSVTIGNGNGCNGNGNTGGNGVYNPCELKLIEANEKPIPAAKQLLKHFITRTENMDAINDELMSDEMVNCYGERYSRRHSSYALELEPAISGGESDEGDEGNDSDTATLSRNSTASSSCIEEVTELEDDASSGNNSHSGRCSDSDSGVLNGSDANKQSNTSFASSGFISSPTTSNASSNVQIDQYTEPSNNWSNSRPSGRSGRQIEHV